MAAVKPEIDISEILNGPRPYDHYERSDEPVTLESLEEAALGSRLNGPEGGIAVLRLIEIIRALQK
jgi:hypothetical protein